MSRVIPADPDVPGRGLDDHAWGMARDVPNAGRYSTLNLDDVPERSTPADDGVRAAYTAAYRVTYGGPSSTAGWLPSGHAGSAMVAVAPQGGNPYRDVPAGDDVATTARRVLQQFEDEDTRYDQLYADMLNGARVAAAGMDSTTGAGARLARALSDQHAQTYGADDTDDDGSAP